MSRQTPRRRGPKLRGPTVDMVHPKLLQLRPDRPPITVASSAVPTLRASGWVPKADYDRTKAEAAASGASGAKKGGGS